MRQLEILVRSNDIAAATALAEHLLASGDAHPLALSLLGAARQSQGRFDEAIVLLRRRARLTPHLAEVWVALGDCMLAARRPGAATVAYDAALHIAPSDAAALCGKARLLHSQSQSKAAERLFDRALGAAPDWPDARLGLANLAIEAGDWTKAAEQASLLGARTPARAATWLWARIELGKGELAAAEARLRTMLCTRDLEPLQRADTLLLLSAALDGLGRTCEAFIAAQDGKSIQREAYAERASSRESETAKLSRLQRWFQSCDPEPWRSTPSTSPVAGEARQHLFLLGFPRSGTTLLEQALAGHPEVTALEEAPTLAAPYDAFLSSAEGLERLSRLTAAEAAPWRARYWQEVDGFGVVAGARLFVDKNPAGALYLPLIAKLFPEAKVLFAVRDPRDVVLSCFRNNFQINAMTYAFTTLTDAAACYDACMSMMGAYAAVLPVSMMRAPHEQLIEAFEPELKVVCDFIGIDLTPDMLDVAATARRRVVRTPSAPQVRAGLNRRGVGRWRAYADDLAPVLPILNTWASRFGYD